MQAIRVLRAQSRPASPAPLVEMSANGSATMASPKLGPYGQGEDQSQGRSGTTISRIQSLTPFHKRAVPTPPPSPAPMTIVQDGAYLNTLGLKLNEAATRALSVPNGTGADVWKGKKPVPSGRGRQFAALIESELDASVGNANLRSAILRLLPRSLSVIVSSLSAQASQLIVVPGFVPSSVTQTLHPATAHGLALAAFASELLETFATYKLGASNSDLAVIRSNLETIITRVITPLFAQIQAEMANLLEPLGSPSNNGSSSPGSFPGARTSKPHQIIATLSTQMPLFNRALKRYVLPYSPSAQTALATFLINTVWTSLVQIAHRSPVGLTAPAASVVHKHSSSSLLSGLTPPASPPMKRLTPPSSPPTKKRILPLTDSPPKLQLRLRRVPSGGSLNSRSSSPDLRNAAQLAISTWVNSLMVDTRAVYDILSSAEVPRPADGSLAREAVDEAFDRLATFRDWFVATSAAGGRLIHNVPSDLPLLIVLPVLLSDAWLERSLVSSHVGTMTAFSTGDVEYPGMAKLIGYDNEETYRKRVLCGFGRAEECEAIVADRVLDRLANSDGGIEWAANVRRWLEERQNVVA
ncbi:SubName: Full=Uncharacterized protein {ECO:0000313/EMBL:CCA72433.1} [Serendipita indica DSM 11827]|nr:SubName: Full=Uncharacterized protein {ECO:0000313/EMBL:CCA72433.1} [Serendipita indica DSM 11827]